MMVVMPGNLGATGIGGRIKKHWRENNTLQLQNLLWTVGKLLILSEPQSLQQSKGKWYLSHRDVRKVDLKLLAQLHAHWLPHPLLILLALLDSRELRSECPEQLLSNKEKRLEGKYIGRIVGERGACHTFGERKEQRCRVTRPISAAPAWHMPFITLGRQLQRLAQPNPAIRIMHLPPQCACACSVASVVSHSSQPYGLWPARLCVHEILQARILEWVARPFSRVPSQPRDWTRVSHVSCTGRQVLYH